jgi:hypothetical protein
MLRTLAQMLGFTRIRLASSARAPSRTAYSADPDQPFRPIVITDSGDRDHGVHSA